MSEEEKARINRRRNYRFCMKNALAHNDLTIKQLSADKCIPVLKPPDSLALPPVNFTYSPR
jgi:hypothetical protein